MKKFIDLFAGIEGFNIGNNSGEVSGQTIFHTHIHLIPRSKGDTNNPRDNPNYNASKSSKLLNKRNVHHSKCLLKHNSSNSSLTRTDILTACWNLAYDKYPSKNYEGKYKNAPCED